jgi:signal transduction histidine kinase
MCSGGQTFEIQRERPCPELLPLLGHFGVVVSGFLTTKRIFQAGSNLARGRQIVFVLPDYAIRLLRAIPEPALFVGADGLVLACNSSARTVLGIAQESPENCQLAAVLGGPQTQLPSTLSAWASSVDPTPGKLTLSLALETVTFEAQGSTIFPRSAGVPEVLLVRLRDQKDPVLLLNQKLGELNAEVMRRIRTEAALRQSEAALRERATEAEALNRAKDEFLSTVSHELRTPLNAILGWADLLRKTSASAEVDKAATVIYRNAKAQAKLIEDVLDLSRVISGKFQIELDSCDLAALVSEVMTVVRPAADAKQLRMTLVPPAQGCVVTADCRRLQQVLWNLLSNAVKFSETAGNVQVELRSDGKVATLSVRDDGIGIDPAFLPFVFDRFKQADSSNTRHVGGLGLGLSLVRHIVELHGGSVDVASAGRNRGTTFTVTLPIRAAVSDVVPAAQPARLSAAD